MERSFSNKSEGRIEILLEYAFNMPFGIVRERYGTVWLNIPFNSLRMKYIISGFGFMGQL